MTSHEALYRAICTAPDDDAPRLAFADLVEDEGDPSRGAFIRTQIELARVPEYDPLWIKCRQFAPGTVGGCAMAHTLPKPLPDGFSWRHYRFLRGFPWLVMALGTDAFAERADDLFATAPIRALSFDDRGRPNLAALASCPALGQLARLEFTSSHLGPDDLAVLGNSTHATGLAELAFAHDGITADGLEVLAGSTLFARVEALELERNAIAPALLIDALAAAEAPGNLRHLALPLCDLYPPDAATLFGLPVVAGLEILDLRDNPHLGADGTQALVERGILRGLRSLVLASTYPGVVGIRALMGTNALAGVRWLDLSANRLGPVAARAIAESDRARGLRILKLANNPIGDKGTIALAGSSALAGLIELDLQDCDVKAAGAMALADSPHLDGLLRLDIRDRLSDRPLADDVRRALLDRFGGRVSFNPSR